MCYYLYISICIDSRFLVDIKVVGSILKLDIYVGFIYAVVSTVKPISRVITIFTFLIIELLFY